MPVHPLQQAFWEEPDSVRLLHAGGIMAAVSSSGQSDAVGARDPRAYRKFLPLQPLPHIVNATTRADRDKRCRHPRVPKLVGQPSTPRGPASHPAVLPIDDTLWEGCSTAFKRATSRTADPRSETRAAGRWRCRSGFTGRRRGIMARCRSATLPSPDHHEVAWTGPIRRRAGRRRRGERSLRSRDAACIVWIRHAAAVVDLELAMTAGRGVHPGFPTTWRGAGRAARRGASATSTTRTMGVAGADRSFAADLNQRLGVGDGTRGVVAH